MGHPSFERSGVFDDVLPVFEPVAPLVVHYSAAVVDGGASDVLLFTPAQTRAPPVRVVCCAGGDGLWTLLMVDPDAPSRTNPVCGEWLHWAVCNARLGSDGVLDIEHADVVTPYAGPTPPKGTGKHRYCFLLFRQSRKVPAVAIDAFVAQCTLPALRSRCKKKKKSLVHVAGCGCTGAQGSRPQSLRAGTAWCLLPAACSCASTRHARTERCRRRARAHTTFFGQTAHSKTRPRKAMPKWLFAFGIFGITLCACWPVLPQ